MKKYQKLNDIALLWKAWKSYGHNLYYKDIINLDTYYRILHLINELEEGERKMLLETL